MPKKNLEERVGFLEKVRISVGEYARIYLVAMGLVLGSASGGCGGDYPEKCCRQLNCPAGSSQIDYECGGASKKKADKCVDIPEGEECCACYQVYVGPK